MHGLSGEEKVLAFKRIRERVLDVRIAKAIDTLREMDPSKGKVTVNKYGFKEMSD